MSKRDEIDSTPRASTPAGTVSSSLRATSICIIGLFTIAVVATAYLLKPVLLPVVLAILAAAALNPVVERCARAGVPRTAVAALVVGGSFAALVVGVWSFSYSVNVWVNSIPEQIEKAEEVLSKLRQPYDTMAEEVDNLVEDEKAPYEPTITVEKEKLSEALFGSTTYAIGYFFLFMVMLYFLIGHGYKIGIRMREAMGHDLLGEIAASISSYLFSISVINVCLGVAIGVAMWILGMPNPPLWALLGFALNYLPYIGAIVGVCLVGFVAIISFNTLLWQVLPPATYLALTLMESNFVTPTVLGKRFPINPFILFVWVIFCGWLWGFAGALIAVPMLMAFRLTCEHFPRLRLLGELIGELPARGKKKLTITVPNEEV